MDYKQTLNKNLEQLRSCTSFVQKTRLIKSKSEYFQKEIDAQLTKLKEVMNAFVVNIIEMTVKTFEDVAIEMENTDPGVFEGISHGAKGNDLNMSSEYSFDANADANNSEQNLQHDTHLSNSKRSVLDDVTIASTSNTTIENIKRIPKVINKKKSLKAISKRAKTSSVASKSINSKKEQLSTNILDASVCRKSPRISAHAAGYFQTKPRAIIFIEESSTSQNEEMASDDADNSMHVDQPPESDKKNIVLANRSTKKKLANKRKSSKR